VRTPSIRWAFATSSTAGMSTVDTIADMSASACPGFSGR